jgi:hypothetical protein
MKRVWIIIGFLAVVGFLLIPMSQRQDLAWMDSISGSEKTQTVWQFGGSSSPVIRESPLAARYRKLGLKWNRDWRNVKTAYTDVLGRNLGSADSFPAPEIYQFALSSGLQKRYLSKSSDVEVRAFFRVMTTGTEAEKKAAVEASCDRALGDKLPGVLSSKHD